MSEPPLLTLTRVTKNFGAVRAVQDFDLVVNHHEVVALVGDNAAGKSTVARMVAGVYPADGGVMRINGRPVSFSSPAEAQRNGVATVFQGLALAENLDVTANLFLGREMQKGRLLAEEEMEQLAREYLDKLHARIASPRTPVSELTAGQRQCVAIARTLVGNPSIVVLDEPTASLSVSQTAEVLSHIQRLRELGLGVILISHSITDVRAVADRIEVMRHGRNNGSFEAARSTYDDIVAAITGATMVQRG